MAANTRLAIAIHTAGVLAFAEDKPITSKMIAQSVKTNPVVIRRIIGNLVKHGLVEVQMGTGGGSRLTRPADKITLADIYRALDEKEIFQVPILGDDHRCRIGRTVRPLLQRVLQDAEMGLIKRLESTTLRDIIDMVRDRLQENGFCTKD